MYTHLSNSDIRFENNLYVFNAYFIRDDGTELNTGIGFDHTPTTEEMTLAVAAFKGTIDGV